MRLHHYGLVLMCLYPAFSHSQGWGDLNLSSRGINRIVNKKMASLVSGPANGTSIASFASFDPANGSFTFKGSTTLINDKKSSRFAFLSLRLEGDLISDNYGILFKNTALNTNAGGEIQLHYRFKKGIRRYFAYGTQQSKLDRDKKDLDNWHVRSRVSIDESYDQNHLNRLISQYAFQIKVLEFRVTDNTQKQTQATGLINTELAKAVPSPIVVNNLSATLTTLEGEAADFSKQIKSLKQKQDSINAILLNTPISLQLDARNKLDRKYMDSLDVIEENVSLGALKFTWFTFIAGASEKGYYTHRPDAGLPFSEQLKRETLKTFRLGLSFNYYSEEMIPSSVFYGNIGIVTYRDNNIRFLSSKQLVQERVIKNAVGDTVRKASKTYNVYDDPIESTNVISLFSNMYFMNENRSIAFHLFPGFDFIKREKSIANLGIGFLTSFKNEKKEKPIINVEAYLKLNDLFGNHPDVSSFWNRNELGVSFSVPINLFK